jgi:hypothetical protein
MTLGITFLTSTLGLSWPQQDVCILSDPHPIGTFFFDYPDALIRYSLIISERFSNPFDFGFLVGEERSKRTINP